MKRYYHTLDGIRASEGDWVKYEDANHAVLVAELREKTRILLSKTVLTQLFTELRIPSDKVREFVTQFENIMIEGVTAMLSEMPGGEPDEITGKG